MATRDDIHVQDVTSTTALHAFQLCQDMVCTLSAHNVDKTASDAIMALVVTFANRTAKTAIENRVTD